MVKPNKNTISIIIPTKNEAENLPRLLKSILSSKTKPKEVIIIDNHSTDNTLRSAKQFLSKHPPKKLKPTTYKLFNKGPERSAQKNFGAVKATATHLLFLDADMELPTELLSKLKKLAKKDARAAVIPECSIGKDFWGKAIALERNLYQRQPLLEAPRFFEKKLFISIGGYDTKLIAGEDWDLSKRLITKKIPFQRTRNQLIHHEARGFIPNLKRKWYYTKHIDKYAQKHPVRFAKQSNFKRRLLIYWQARNKLAKYPTITIAFLLIKTIIFFRWKLAKLSNENKKEKKVLQKTS